MGAYLKSDTNRLNSSSHIFNVFAWGEKTSLMVDGATYAAKKQGPDPLMPAIAPDGHSRDPLHEVHPPKSISYAQGAGSVIIAMFKYEHHFYPSKGLVILRACGITLLGIVMVVEGAGGV